MNLPYEMVLLYVFRVLVFNNRIRLDGTGFASRMNSGAGGALLFLANTMFFLPPPDETAAQSVTGGRQYCASHSASRMLYYIQGAGVPTNLVFGRSFR